MKRKYIILLNIFLIFISITSMIILIGYKKKKINSNSLLILNSIEDNIDFKSFKLNTIELIFIFIVSVLLIICLTLLIKNIFNIHILRKSYIAMYIVGATTLCILISSIIIGITNNYVLNNKNKLLYEDYDNDIIRPVGCNEIIDNTDYKFKKYSCMKNDTNTFLLKNGSNSNLSNLTIYKYGESSNLLSAKVYGTNSAILVLKDTKLNITNSTIDTFDSGCNGLFGALDNSYIYANMLNIQTSASDSSGIVASLNSHVEAANIKIKTSSQSSPAISSLRGGVIDIDSAIVGTNSTSSPIIHTSSIVNMQNSVGDANNSQAVILEGAGNVKISNSNIRVSATKFSKRDLDSAFYIYRNFKIKNFKEYANINIVDSTIEIKKQSKVYDKAPMFSINNNNANINISNNEFIYGSDIFIDVLNTNNDSIYVNLNSSKQKIHGDINADNKSVLELNFKDTNYLGSINHDNVSKKITLNIDLNSVIELNDDSYVSIINNEDKKYTNIISNGYNLYYNSDLNKELDNKTIELSDGGKLLPV